MSDQPTPQLHLSYGPHIRRGRTTTDIMWMVNAALLPALVWATLVFGWQVVGITISSILGCLFAEHLVCKIQKKETTIMDGSVVCTGLLLAYTLPPGIPLWMPFIGGALGTADQGFAGNLAGCGNQQPCWLWVAY